MIQEWVNMVVLDTEMQMAALLPIPTERSLGTVSSHPRERIIGSSPLTRVDVNTVMLYRIYLNQ